MMEDDAKRLGVKVTKGTVGQVPWAYAFNFPDYAGAHLARMEPDGWFYAVSKNHGWPVGCTRPVKYVGRGMRHRPLDAQPLRPLRFRCTTHHFIGNLVTFIYQEIQNGTTS